MGEKASKMDEKFDNMGEKIYQGNRESGKEPNANARNESIKHTHTHTLRGLQTFSLY